MSDERGLQALWNDLAGTTDLSPPAAQREFLSTLPMQLAPGSYLTPKSGWINPFQQTITAGTIYLWGVEVPANVAVDAIGVGGCKSTTARVALYRHTANVLTLVSQSAVTDNSAGSSTSFTPIPITPVNLTRGVYFMAFACTGSNVYAYKDTQYGAGSFGANMWGSASSAANALSSGAAGPNYQNLTATGYEGTFPATIDNTAGALSTLPYGHMFGLRMAAHV